MQQAPLELPVHAPVSHNAHYRPRRAVVAFEVARDIACSTQAAVLGTACDIDLACAGDQI
jgi:hypothetical protein